MMYNIRKYAAKRAGLILSSVLMLTTSASAANPQGRFVRVELPGNGRTLSLAEVEVLENGQNVAQGKKATASSVWTGNRVSGVADHAVDGDTGGIMWKGSVTHTEPEDNPW